MSAEVFIDSKVQKASRMLKNPLSFRAFTLGTMPLGFLAGLHVVSLDDKSCVVGIPGGWRTQNPFRSMYWAAQGMAAEMAAGLHAAMYTKSTSVPVSMILAGCSGKFVRQCIGKAQFVCDSGEEIRRAIAETAVSGERIPCEVTVYGKDPGGEVVSEWTFQWSFKGKPGAKNQA